MNKILGIALAITCAFIAFHLSVKVRFTNPYLTVCSLVIQKIYLDNENTKQWHHLCLRRANLVSAYSKKELIAKDISNVLALLKVSHLEIFTPSEVKKIWRGQNLETGIESEFVDGELVIFKVHPDSTSAKEGLRRGDIIVSINGEHPNPWAASEAGDFLIRNRSGEKAVRLGVSELKRDEAPMLTTYLNRRAQLIVPSFRAEYFDDDKVSKLKEELSFYREVVVDLRGNIGGNFVAGLRLLSLFICEPTSVGKLERPRAKLRISSKMNNSLNDDEQLKQLDSVSDLELITFATKGCFKGRVQVLVDSKTASVAEMVAQALKEHRQAKILGAPSRGQLLVGVWYPLNELKVGAQISIPEARYVSSLGRTIEGEGVTLDRVLYYDLLQMKAGIDSWVQSALD